MKRLMLKKYLLLLMFCALSLLGEASGIKVYIIISEDCPICQYMGPELASINEYYGAQAELYLVFPFKNSNIKKASLYKQEFGLSNFEVLIDEDQSISRKLGAKLTPEAIIVNDQNEIIYRGRINDAYLAPGRRKRSAGRKDLQIAISNALNDKPVKTPWPKAIGCFVTYTNIDK